MVTISQRQKKIEKNNRESYVSYTTNAASFC